jgi:hypothetical protein
MADATDRGARVRKTALGVLIMLGLLGAADVAILWSSPAAGDWYQFYWAGHIIVTGGSPYDPSAWIPAAQAPEVVGGAVNIVRGNCPSVQAPQCLWLYPPWTALVFAPFGALPADAGITLLRLALIGIGVVAVVMVVRETALPAAMPLAAAVALAFQPLLLATRTGHFDALLLIGALLIRRGLSGSTISLVAGTLLLSLKPHLTVVLFALAAVLLIRRGRLRDLTIMATIGGVIAAVTLLVYPPPPLSTLLAESAGRTEFGSPTTALLARTLADGAWPALAAVFLVVAVGCAVRIARHPRVGLRDSAAVAAALGVSLVIAPYEHAYDHTLLLPAALLAVAGSSAIARPSRRAAVLATVIAAVVLYPWLAFFWGLATESGAAAAVLPVLILSLLAVVLEVARRAAGPSARPIGNSP